MSADHVGETGQSYEDVAAQGSADTTEEETGDAGLSQALVQLSQLTNETKLEELLRGVATLAVTSIPGAEGAGLILIESHRADTIVSSADFVREVHNVQYGIGQGPCITAVEEGQIVMSGSLGSDPRWRRFGGTVARLGVHSALSLPLITAAGVIGALNIYAHHRHAFDERAAQLGAMYAVPAAVAVQNARVLAETRRLTARLEAALATRGVIDQAVGILMSRGGGTEREALDRLRVLSQHEHAKLGSVAQSIVDEAVRRARSRRADHSPEDLECDAAVTLQILRAAILGTAPA